MLFWRPLGPMYSCNLPSQTTNLQFVRFLYAQWINLNSTTLSLNSMTLSLLIHWALKINPLEVTCDNVIEFDDNDGNDNNIDFDENETKLSASKLQSTVKLSASATMNKNGISCNSIVITSVNSDNSNSIDGGIISSRRQFL